MNNFFWTEDEKDIVAQGIKRDLTYQEISDLLFLAGYNRSNEAVRYYIRKRQDPKRPSEEDKRWDSFIEDEPECDSLVTIQPKILLLDIETLPIKVYTWNLFKPVITPEMIVQDWCILTWSAKWLFNSEMMSDSLTPEEAINRDDSRILDKIWHLINESDIVIGHNCDKFDIKKLNSRFFINQMLPLMPYKTIDTLKQSRALFGFTSNKLNYLSQMINKKEKLHTDFKLWIDCDRGDPKALERMLTYNQMDVLLLEELYVELRPWMKTGPNMGIYMDLDKMTHVCSHCGSEQLVWGGFYTTTANKYKTFRCLNCHGVGRSRVSSISSKQRKLITNH